MNRILNVGVIGAGVIGKHHVQSYIDNPKANVVAVADINEELAKTVAADFGVEFFKDYRDLLSLAEVEAVSVCTPPFSHASIVREAAKAGKHVLCEKPMAMNAEEAEGMVEACQRARVKLGIGSSRSRLHVAVETAREYVRGGKLGKIYYVRASNFRRRGRPGLDVLKESKWFLDSSKAGGGALIDIGCYDLDAILYILGSPQPLAVNAMTFRGVGSKPKLDVIYDVEEHSSLMVRFQDGPVATVETAWAANMDRGGGLILFGSEGGLKLDPFTFYSEQARAGAPFTFFREQEERQVAIMIDLPSEGGDFVEDFLTACLENGSPKTPGEDGLKVMQIISMAYLSSKLGREVTINDLKKSHGGG